MRFSVILALAFVAAGCGDYSSVTSADQAQEAATQQITAQANSEIGMPGIANFQERRLVRTLYELRDQEGLVTYTYIVDLNGGLHLLCQSIGYGIPYSTQFTNPEREAYSTYDGGFGTLPQPEPNGLFMPESAAATWVMCSDGEQTRPVYVEPTIIVSPFALTQE